MDNKKKIKNNINNLSKMALNTLEKNNKKKKTVKKTVKIEADNPKIKEVQNKINEKKILEDVIGKNVEKIDSSEFNFAAAIFNFSYFIYRKMYLTALILISIIITAKLLIRDNLIFISVYVVISVICGVFFNKYYKNIIMNKIKKLNFKSEEIRNKKMEKISKRNLILAIVSYVLVVGLIVILTLNIKTITVLSTIVAFINSINISEYKFYKMNSTNLVNIVEKYNETAIYELESPGEYTYRINDKKYNFVAIPYSENKKDVICLYKKKKWENGSEFAQNSSTCEQYFKDIFNNYNKDDDMSLITNAKIVISNKGRIVDKTYLKYDNITCKYNFKNHEFKCSK